MVAVPDFARRLPVDGDPAGRDKEDDGRNFAAVRSSGLIAMDLEAGDELVAA